MQEFQPVPGAAGRLFGVGTAAAVPEEEVRCPRCDSANTKFCYYNNYNLAQPRHFCRGCRRFWTKGGLLRNVPVGGGCRKPKRQVTTSSSDGDAHRDVKNARSGCTGTGGSYRPAAASSGAASTTSSTVGAAAAAAAHSSGGSTKAAGVGPGTFAADAPPPPLPRPRPMFADQAAAFALFFVSPPLPATSFSSQPKAEDDVAVAPARALAEQQPSLASSTADVAPFSARSGGAAMASAAADWQPSTVIDAGMFDVLAGDASSYDWNTASWTTDPEGTMYLP